MVSLLPSSEAKSGGKAQLISRGILPLISTEQSLSVWRREGHQSARVTCPLPPDTLRDCTAWLLSKQRQHRVFPATEKALAGGILMLPHSQHSDWVSPLPHHSYITPTFGSY